MLVHKLRGLVSPPAAVRCDWGKGYRGGAKSCPLDTRCNRTKRNCVCALRYGKVSISVGYYNVSDAISQTQLLGKSGDDKKCEALRQTQRNL